MVKTKITIEELSAQADLTSKDIVKSFAKVILKDQEVAKQTAINIVQLVAQIEEIFNRILHRKKGTRVAQRELLQAIKSLGVNEDFFLAFEKLKILRNRIVHQISFIDPILNYLSHDLRGLDHCHKMKKRIDVVINITHEEVYYLYN